MRRCPFCGSPRLARVRKPFAARVGRRTVTIPEVEREVCPDCKEEFFDREANIVIDDHCFGMARKRA